MTNDESLVNKAGCSILAVGRLTPRAVPDRENIVNRSMMTATLCADHRIVRGPVAAQILREVKGHLQET